MSLEGTIRTRWLADATLVGLVPAGQLSLGQQFKTPTDPFVVITHEGQTTITRATGDNETNEVTIQFLIVSADLDTAKQIATAIKAEFNRPAAFSTTDGDVINMQRGYQTQNVSPDGIWEIVSRYNVTLATTISA